MRIYRHICVFLLGVVLISLFESLESGKFVLSGMALVNALIPVGIVAFIDLIKLVINRMRRCD